MCKYVVIDLEMCRVNIEKPRKEYGYYTEIIEIGAVILDESLEITETFKTYVSPRFGKVDKYIQRLTGITNRTVENAPGIEEAMRSFMDWIPEDATWIAWSNSDKYQIENEMRLKNISVPGIDRYLSQMIDCQQLFADRKKTERKYKLSDALMSACVDYRDGEHDALIDAHNTALLFSKMEKNPDMEFISYCPKGEELKNFTYVPLYELFPQFNFAS